MRKLARKIKRAPASKAGRSAIRPGGKSGGERAGHDKRVIVRGHPTNAEVIRALNSVTPGTLIPLARRMDVPEITPMRLDEYQRHNLIVLLQAIAESRIGPPINSGDWASGSVDMALDQLISEEEIAAYQASGEGWSAWMRKHIRGNATVDELVKWFKERGKPPGSVGCESPGTAPSEFAVGGTEDKKHVSLKLRTGGMVDLPAYFYEDPGGDGNSWEGSKVADFEMFDDYYESGITPERLEETAKSKQDKAFVVRYRKWIADGRPEEW